MSDTRYPTLEDVIRDEAYPELDLALRRGRHVDRDDAVWYSLLVDAQDHLEPLYRRYGCELVHKSDGYFYLLPTNERLGKRHLSPPEMLVGQALALLYLDPATVESGGVVSREHVLGHLAGVVGSDVLVKMMNPKRKRYDERVAAEAVRTAVAGALRRLAGLAFIEAVDDSRYRLRASLLRFAEPLRGAGSPAAQLAELVAAGEIVLDAEDEATEGFELPPIASEASSEKSQASEESAELDEESDELDEESDELDEESEALDEESAELDEEDSPEEDEESPP